MELHQRLTPDTTQRCSHAGIRSTGLPVIAAERLRSAFISCCRSWTLVIISPTDNAVLSSPSVPSNGISVEMSREPSVTGVSSRSQDHYQYSRFISHSPPHMPTRSDPAGMTMFADTKISYDSGSRCQTGGTHSSSRWPGRCSYPLRRRALHSWRTLPRYQRCPWSVAVWSAPTDKKRGSAWTVP